MYKRQESSQSCIVVKADSIIISSTPALSPAPMLPSLFTNISIWRLLFLRRIQLGFLASPWYPIYWLFIFKYELVPFKVSTKRELPSILYEFTSLCEQFCNGKFLSKNSLAYDITLFPLIGL